jgi:hypothetical protein
MPADAPPAMTVDIPLRVAPGAVADTTVLPVADPATIVDVPVSVLPGAVADTVPLAAPGTIVPAPIRVAPGAVPADAPAAAPAVIVLVLVRVAPGAVALRMDCASAAIGAPLIGANPSISYLAGKRLKVSAMYCARYAFPALFGCVLSVQRPAGKLAAFVQSVKSNGPPARRDSTSATAPIAR